ncbi:Major Facilitator Superfamily (MFS) [Phytophthora cinnamomi]|uniref:Major Facilitator Superfamily (MFS) n=1 Tax=Phytophthora cinnamomi TaxID=4785 RepID=UPI00355A5DB4|nr:Major Facilitator Superfamily (MFS) [Phytophthora cinnamomi]
MVVMARFQRCPSGSLLDHAVLDVLERAGGEYGKQRLFGAVGWGSGLLQRIPPVKYGDDDGGKHNTLERGDEERRGASEMKSFVESAKLLTKELDVLVLLGVVFLMGLMYGVIASFLTLNLYNLSGGDPRIVGIAVMCQTSSELPAFFFADRIIKKIGTVKVLLVSVLGYAVRIAYYTTMTNAWGAIPFEFLHGVTFGLAWAACTQYIYSASPRGCASTVMGS